MARSFAAPLFSTARPRTLPMPNRLKNLIKFRLERLLLRGAGFRLLVIAALIGLVALAGGVLVYATTAGFADAGRGDLVGLSAPD